MPLDTEGYPPEFAKLLDAYNVDVDDLMASLEAGDITPAQWRTRMDGMLAMYSQTARMIGMDTATLDAEAKAQVHDWYVDQGKYLDGFESVIESAGGEFSPAWTPRARMYAASTVTQYWEGKTAGLPLPAQPGQGTQCMCITTPDSRIATMRGLVPIKDVVVGDLVLTHLSRWRRVINTFIRLSRPSHRQAWVTSPWGTRVGCTSDHRFLTADGWKKSMCIDNSMDIIYNFTHENILSIMWNATWESGQGPIVRKVSGNLSLRKTKGSQSQRMYFVRNESQGESSMGEYAGKDVSRTSRGIAAQMEGLRRIVFSGIQRQEEGREILHVLSGYDRKDALHLPLSMGMDTGERAYSEGVFYSPSEWGSYGRQAREFEYDTSRGTCQNSHDGRTEETTSGWWQKETRWPTSWVKDKLDMSELPKEILVLSEGGNFRPQVLLSEMPHTGTLLYDIEVEDDHSFIVEGLVSHNSNCRCKWEIRWLDKDAGNADAYWRLSPVESCSTCLTRAEMWSPVRVRNWDLVS